MPFDGKTYERDLDGKRLGAQLHSVLNLMLLKNKWWTLAEIEEETGHPQSSISARIRDLRKTKFGGYEVERRRVAGKRGLFEYHLVIPKEQLELCN
jgi:hypothetical protein